MVKISNLDLSRVKPVCVFGKSKQTLTLFRTGLFGAASEVGRPTLPKFCRTNPTMKKLGTVIPCLKKIQKIYKSLDTSLEIC